jgi:hypothetical protein
MAFSSVTDFGRPPVRPSALARAIPSIWFIDQNPVMRELPGMEVTLSALVKAYPCPK